MSRLTDFVLLIVAVLLFVILQFIGGAMLNPMSDELQAEGIDSSYNADETFADMIATITVWVPLTGLIGAIFLVMYREYRRQRVTALRR